MREAEGIKRLPERQEIEPGTKTAFRDDKQRAGVADETFWNTVAAEENIAGFFQPVVIREIDVIKISGNRCTLSVEFEVGRLYSGLFHVSYSSDRQCHDLNDADRQAQIYPLIV